MNEFDDLVSLTMRMNENLEHISGTLRDISATLKRIESSNSDNPSDVRGKNYTTLTDIHAKLEKLEKIAGGITDGTDDRLYDIYSKLEEINLQLQINGKE